VVILTPTQDEEKQEQDWVFGNPWEEDKIQGFNEKPGETCCEEVVKES
jgi:hypothetical protein